MVDSLPRIDPADELTCLGHEEDLAAQGGALAPPIVQTSLFAQATLADLAAGLADEHAHPVYTRGNNPTVRAVEEKIAKLERGESCRCLASGMAAVSAVLLSQLAAGDHVLFVNQTYGPTLQLARYLERFGISHGVVLDLDLAAIEAGFRDATRLVWLESPGTMLFRAFDVAAVAAAARARGIISVLDNSWASPLFQKPLTLGVDLVVHSATKYIGGHSDVMAGAVVGSAECMERLFYDTYLLNGGILGPFDAWLLNRGLRTLPLRMRQHHRDGLALATWLAGHAKVRRVFHPGLAGENALSGYSGLFSFELDTEDHATVSRFVDALARFRIGVSWGGVESLVIAPYRGDNAEALAAQGLPRGLVRVSIGLEGFETLRSDLDQALGAP
jgi:cystathionine beta-lyase/cystathionine gamma-synthase